MKTFLAALIAAFMPGLAAAQLIQEFFNSFTGHYFITASSDEAAGVAAGVAGPGWKNTGYQFFGESNGVPVCRFYAPLPTNSHFYTADAAECDFLKTHNTGWQYEGIAFRANVPTNGICSGGRIPVYRMYNNRAAALDSNHRFNADDRVASRMAAQGWIVEGVAFCTGNFAAPRAPRVASVFLSPSIFSDPPRPDPFCNTAFSGNESCIVLTALVAMTEHLNSWVGDLQMRNPAYTQDFAAKTGWIAGVDTVYSASFAGTPAERSFVESFGGGQVVGVHLAGSERRFGNYATISPAIRLRDPTGVPFFPWADRGAHDILVNFQLKIATIVRSDDSAQAYGGPVLEFADNRSGLHLLLRVLAYGSRAPSDFTGIDPVTGNVMVSTTFFAPRFGAALTGQYIACAFARLATGGCPAPGIDYSLRIDQNDFAKAIGIARTVNPALSNDIADYVLVSLQMRNETFGDAELGLLENRIQIFVTD